MILRVCFFLLCSPVAAVMKVGFVLLGSPDDFGWNFQHNAARLAVEKRFYGQVVTVVQEHVGEWGPNTCDFCKSEPGWNSSKGVGGGWDLEPADFVGTHECAMVIKKMIESDGVDMIITTSFYFHWDTYYMAAKYPTKHFVHASGWLTRPNMAVVFPKVYQARYLSGIAMGWYIKKKNLPKKVGFVSAFSIGETSRHINAFKLGLETVDPAIEVYLTWMLSWDSVRKIRIATERLLKFYGAEGITQHADIRDPQMLAKQYGKVGVGYNTDMLYTVGDSVLTSPVLDWANAYAGLVQKALNNDATYGQDQWKGLDAGWWRLSELSPLVPIEAQKQIDEAMANFSAGTDEIFCKPNLRDNRGRVRNEVGKPNPTVNPVPWESTHLVGSTSCLTGPVINQMCQKYEGTVCKEHWLLEGVHDNCDKVNSTGLPAGVCYLGNMGLPDQCAGGEYLSLLGCAKSPAGFYAKDEKMISCPKGYEAPSEGLTACSPCQPGHIASSMNTTKCQSCSRGEYADEAGKTECRQCERGHFASSTGSSACAACGIGFYSASTSATACEACPADRPTTVYRRSTVFDSCTCLPGTHMRNGTCRPCPAGMSCAGFDAAPVLLPGFWAQPSDPYQAMKCRNTGACPGGEVTDNVCGKGRVGFACAICPVNKFREFNSGECSDCTAGTGVPMALFITCFIFAPFLLNLFFSSSYAKRSSSDAVVCAMMFGQLVSYSQIFSILGTLSVDWPAVVAWFLNTLRILAFKFDLLMPACLFNWNFLFEFFLGVLIPVLFVLVYCAQWAISVFLAKAKVIKKPYDKIVVASVSGRVFLIFHVAILKQATKVFECYEHPNGERSLIEFPNIKCFESEHITTMPVAILMMIFYCLVVVAYLCYTLRVAPKRFREKRFFALHSFLMLKFRPDRWYWALPVYVRNTILCLIVICVPDHPILQVMLFNFVVTMFMALALFLEPWRDARNNTLEFTLALVLTVFSLATLPLLPHDPNLTSTLTSIMVAALVCEAVVIIRVTMQMAVVQQIKKTSIKAVKTMMKKEKKSEEEHDLQRVVPACADVPVAQQKPAVTRQETHEVDMNDREGSLKRQADALQQMCRTLSQMESRLIFNFLALMSMYDQRLVSAWMRLVSTELNIANSGTVAEGARLKERPLETEPVQSGGDATEDAGPALRPLPNNPSEEKVKNANKADCNVEEIDGP
eukprot:TRINITY_DN4510_c0_g2_i1.p1 TRINITY_DN4510_c0_g2~~TRINITY_DN4510_c0_g2_i1.p1  ORF type:complete len:1195 (-),score=151.00 TRINITY_DN4510_c0_g2_i1:206-3790(-)